MQSLKMNLVSAAFRPSSKLSAGTLNGGRMSVMAGTLAIVAIIGAGAGGASLAAHVSAADRPVIALSADEGVPRNLVTAMKADEGVPQNLVAAMNSDEGVPQNLVTAMRTDEGSPFRFQLAMPADQGVPHDLVTA
jgi:hypothetical protein